HFFLFFFPFFTLLSFFYSSFQNCEEYTFSPGFAIFGGIRIAACSYICVCFLSTQFSKVFFLYNDVFYSPNDSSASLRPMTRSEVDQPTPWGSAGRSEEHTSE